MRRRSPTALVLFAVLALHASIASADTALLRADLTPAGDPLPPNLGNVGAFVSADGQWIGAHGFLRNLATGALVQWALDTDGTPVHGYGPGGARIISDDARYIAFIAGSYYNHPRFLRRDRVLGTTIELPIGIGGPVNGTVFGITLSGNGNIVAFHSDGGNVVAGVAGGIFQVFAHDVAAGTTELISAAPDGSPGNNTSSWPYVSADGRFVAFDCFASNLVPGFTEAAQICVRDRATATTSVASVDSVGNPSTGSYGSGPLSADGRYVTFTSTASNLVPGDGGGWGDVFVHDQMTGVTERISVSATGGDANGNSGPIGITPDGGRVYFLSSATNLLGDGTGGALFVRDRNAGVTSLVTRYGGPFYSVSNDGRFAGGGVATDSFVDNDAPPACTGGVPMDRPLITLDGGHMRIRTNLVMPPGTFDPMSRGVQLVLEDMGSNAFGIYDLSYRTVPIQPAASASCGPDDGWTVKHAGLDQRYRNESNALRGPSCVFGTAHGLYDARLKDARATHGRVSFRAKARGGPLALPIGALRMTVVLAGDQAASDGGECATHTFAPTDCTLISNGTILRCR